MKRYVFEAEKEIVEEVFGVQSDSQIMFEPNYNVISGATMPIIINTEGGRKVVQSVWGLKFKDSDDGVTEIGQEEILKNKEQFSLLEQKACIIPISGFYKWKETVEDPLPFYLRVIKNDVTGVAGVYNVFENKEGRTIHTFSVITMPANALVEPLDNRMPVILSDKQFEEWLSGGAKEMIEAEFSGNHLLPDMTVFRVPELVNDPSNNSKELVQPIPKLRNYDGPEEG